MSAHPTMVYVLHMCVEQERPDEIKGDLTCFLGDCHAKNQIGRYDGEQGSWKLFGNAHVARRRPNCVFGSRRGRKLRHVIHYNLYFRSHRALQEPQSGHHL
uniref:Uncharacterized protein n=1 Tax=Candidatus Kentrum sp. LFY TaxID=2126342 RepID=A0A450UBB3_9GAMM|nr:MAG: hypothetical protein BECKLFY1418B_GA0070995_101527 [Candidatus Kentron sp. LFY]